MLIRLEEVTCIALAFAAMFANIGMFLIAPLVAAFVGIPETAAHLAGTALVSMATFAAVYNIPSSWYFKIVYVMEDNKKEQPEPVSELCLEAA